MNYEVGQRLQWTPKWWKWDLPRQVEVVKTYPRNRALLDNGVIVDEDGMAVTYGVGREVGSVVKNE